MFFYGIDFTSDHFHCAILRMNQKRLFLKWFVWMYACLVGFAAAQSNDPSLQQQLGGVYNVWRNAMIKNDARAWSSVTSKNRQLEVRNRVYSERKAFPQAVFNLPIAPPALAGLKALRAHRKGATATAVYFGNVDFGVGGEPSENVLLLHFVAEAGAWKYDKANFISLQMLPYVRKALKAGDYTYVDQKDFLPSGIAPIMPIPVAPADYVAKVYVFCPGREVKMKVNKISDHRFQDTKAAEVVIGGGKDGVNEVQFATKSLEGSTGKEALAIRVYLLSSVHGTKPLKAFEYQVQEGGAVKPFGSGNFVIDAKVAKQLKGH